MNNLTGEEAARGRERREHRGYRERENDDNGEQKREGLRATSSDFMKDCWEEKRMRKERGWMRTVGGIDAKRVREKRRDKGADTCKGDHRKAEVVSCLDAVERRKVLPVS